MMLCFILIGCSIFGMALIPTYAHSEALPSWL